MCPLPEDLNLTSRMYLEAIGEVNIDVDVDNDVRRWWVMLDDVRSMWWSYDRISTVGHLGKRKGGRLITRIQCMRCRVR